MTTGSGTINRPRPRAGLCISPQMEVGVPCTSWVTRISHLTILSVHLLACRIKEGEFAALCCPARVAFAQASPLHRPLPEQPPPFSRPARLHPWGCTQRLSGVPLTFPEPPMLVPSPSHSRNTTQRIQAGSLTLVLVFSWSCYSPEERWPPTPLMTHPVAYSWSERAEYVCQMCDGS